MSSFPTLPPGLPAATLRDLGIGQPQPSGPVNPLAPPPNGVERCLDFSGPAPGTITPSGQIHTDEHAASQDGAHKLRVLSRLSSEVNTILEVDELLERVMDIILEVITCDRAYIILMVGGKLVPKVIRKKAGVKDHKGLSISGTILNQVLRDLDRRQAPANPLAGKVTLPALPGTRRRLGRWALGGTLTLAAIVAGGWAQGSLRWPARGAVAPAPTARSRTAGRRTSR